MTSKPTVLVLVTGDPVPAVEEKCGGFADMIRMGVGRGASEFKWLERDVREGQPSDRSVDGVFITGSPSSVTEQTSWMTSAQDYVKRLVDDRIPVLGICFGHQLLAAALGGRVARNPRGREMGTVRVEVGIADRIVGEMGPIVANATHVDSVVELPEGAEVLGRTALEPHAAVRFEESAWGVQFHPEIDRWSMEQYILARRELLNSEGFPVESALASLQNTPGAAGIMARFLRHLLEP